MNILRYTLGIAIFKRGLKMQKECELIPLDVPEDAVVVPFAKLNVEFGKLLQEIGVGILRQKNVPK